MKRTLEFFSACAAAALIAAGCARDNGNSETSGNTGGGGGGSMARFTIAGEWLYTVSHDRLTVVSIADPARPEEGGKLWIGSDIETIFAMDTLLFIGSQSSMQIYDISEPESPEFMSQTSHLKSCDPVVAADTLAFVTLNSSLGSWCGQRGDLLVAYDISDVTRPVVIDEVGLSSPRGLAVDAGQKLVFVCDNGIKAFDVTDPHDIKLLYTAAKPSVPEVGRIDAYDCILWDGRLLVIGAAGLYQLGYDREKFTFISKIEIRNVQSEQFEGSQIIQSSN